MLIAISESTLSFRFVATFSLFGVKSVVVFVDIDVDVDVDFDVDFDFVVDVDIANRFHCSW